MLLTNELKNYCNDVINKKITACIKHTWACERFLRDIENQNTEAFPYLFDEKSAEKFLRWMRLFQHTKGPLAGEHIEPVIFQKFVAGNIYGWYHRDTLLRRFTKVYLQVARKNAKSQLLSAIATYEAMVFNGNKEISEVYCAATDRKQAQIVYKEALNQLRNCKKLKGKWKESYKQIVHINSDSFIVALSREDKKKGDGFNPQCVIIDEYHAHETTEMYDILESGQTARTEPLIVIITTAGLDLNSPCYRIEYKLATELLKPDNDVEMNHVFAMICELEVNQTSEDIILEDGTKIAPGELIDDINNLENWKKANPIVCSYQSGIDKMRERFEETKLSPEKLRNFKTKYLNIWVNQRLFGYMVMPKWTKCKRELPNLHGEIAYLGVDLSAKIDLTSVTFIFPNAVHDKYVVKSHSFIPYSRLQERIQNDKMPFDLWQKEGWITETPGEMVDHREIVTWCDKIIQENSWYIENWCIDPWCANQIYSLLLEQGKKVVEIRQGLQTLAEPTKDFRAQTYAGNIVHDGNPVLNWAMGNAVTTKMDRNENFLISKHDSTDRIDPLAATLNAYTMAMVAPKASIYEQRGLR